MHNVPRKPKVLFILKLRQSYGETGNHTLKSAGLFNSAMFVKNELLGNGYDAKLVQVEDNNAIDREVTLFKPDIVIIEALWVVPEKFDVLKRLHPKVKWVVRLHSELPFLANEGVAFEWINKYVRQENVWVSANSDNAYTDLRKYFKECDLHNKILYLPNYFPVSTKRVTTPSELWDVGETINIGCFGAVRPMKNHLLQAAAAIQFADEKGLRLRFHINAGRVEQRGENTVKNLQGLFAGTDGRHELVEHGWLDRDEYLKLVDTMDLGLQVSFSESFNIVSADFVERDIPIVTSKEVHWMPSFFTAHPTSTDSIVRAMKRVLFYDRHFIWLDLQRKALTKYAKHAIFSWNRTLFNLWW